jgi:hypothetical protein
MFCSKCGENLSEGSVFCQKCGTRVGNGISDAVQPQPDTEIQKPKVIKNLRVFSITGKFLSVVKALWKPFALVIIVIIALMIMQNLGGFNLIDFMSNLLGIGSSLGDGTTEFGQEITIPVFEITSLRINYLKNISWRDIEVNDPIRLNIGTITILVEFDSYATLGMRNPESVRLQGAGKQVFVDKSSIIIEVLDAYVTNYRHINSFVSNPLLQTWRYTTPEKIFEIQAGHEAELKEKIIMNSQTNFNLAKENFMLNYELLCTSMGLEVKWAENSEEFHRLVDEASAPLL